MDRELKHWRVDLRWIGYGPGSMCPSFWKDRRLSMRIGLEGDQQQAIRAVRNTWRAHEAEVIRVVETDLMGEEK